MDPLRAVAREMKKLSPKLKMLLLEGVKQCGSYEPDEALIWVEERMTAAEHAVATAFLTWMSENDLTFGSGNINQRFEEFNARSN